MIKSIKTDSFLTSSQEYILRWKWSCIRQNRENLYIFGLIRRWEFLRRSSQFYRTMNIAGYVASTCNPASGRLGIVDGLKLGVLLDGCLRWTGVRTKPGIDMDRLEESGGSRLPNEERNGPDGKPSSQKFPCRAVVGSRPWVGAIQ